MEQSPWSDAANQALTWDTLDPAADGTYLWLGAPGQGALDGARALLAAGRPFVLVARNLPEAVRLTQTLAPESADILVRAAEAAQGPARVALFRGHARPAVRVALAQGLERGERLGLVMTSADLASSGVVAALGVLTCAPIWLVQDAHRMSVSAPDFDADLLALEAVRGFGARILYTDLESPTVMLDLGRRLGFGPEALVRGDSALASSVQVTVELGEGVLQSRDALRGLLERHLPRGEGAQCVVVAPLQGEGTREGLPTAELVSVGEELGLHAVSDPGEDADAQAERWLRILRRQRGLLLTEDPAALSILPEGSAPVFFRLVPPESPEAIFMEVRQLARIGGGRWVYSGSPAVSEGSGLDISGIQGILGPLLADAEGSAPLAFDALEAVRSAGLGGSGALSEGVLTTFLRDLRVLAGLGLFRAARPVRLSLVVADGKRFRSPFVDENPTYVDLLARYNAALEAMSMGDSIRFRLEAREPHDLREWSRVLGLDVFTLGGIFDDLARDGLLACRLLNRSGPAGLDVELVPEGRWDQVRERLPEALGRLGLWRERTHRLRLLTREVLSAEDPAAALVPVLGRELDHLTLPISREEDAGERPAAPSAPDPEARAAVSRGLTWDLEGVVDAPVEPAEPETRATTALEGLVAEVGARGADAGLDVALAMALALAAEEEGASLGDLDLGDHGRLGQSFQRVLAWETEEAIGELAAWAATDGTLPWGEIVPRVEFYFTDDGGAPVSAVPAAALELAMALPLVETLPGEAARGAIESLRGDLDVQLADLGSATLRLPGGEGLRLERRGGAPEVEAQLWLALAEAEVESPARGLRAARLAELYLALAGLGDDALTGQLSGAILALGEVAPSAVSPRRFSFARARALVESGDGEGALTALLEVEAPEGLEKEHARALGLAALEPASIRRALAWAFDQTDARQVSRVVAALKASEGVPGRVDEALASYGPEGEALWAFILRDPFSEGDERRRARVLGRLEGEGPKDLATLTSLGDALGLDLVAEALGPWAASMEGSPEQWLTLAEALAGAGHWEAMDVALSQLPEGSEVDALSLARLKVGRALAQGALGDALLAGEALPLREVQRHLLRALGEGWVEALQGAEIPPEAEALRDALVQQAQAWAERLAARGVLEDALKVEDWDATAAAMEALRALVGDEGDRVLAKAQDRRQEKIQGLVKRLGQLERRELSRVHPDPLARLRDELQAFGDEEATARASALLARVQAEAPVKAAAPERPPRSERSQERSQERSPERARRPRSDAPAGRSFNAHAALEGPTEGLAERFTEALAQCPGDRERGALVLEAMGRFDAAGDVESGLRALRDSLGSFDSLTMMDGALARRIAAGSPPDENLGRLKRILEKQAMRFRSSLEAIATRENPEPWKQLLSQLKL